jgi:Ca-activated chloride channel family protein
MFFEGCGYGLESLNLGKTTIYTIIHSLGDGRMQLEQIILITDGCSNVGLSPVVAAAHAKAEGIVVNVIGIIDQGELGELGASEIREIAEAGGGMSRLSTSSQLAQTVQMMTRRTVVGTIHEAVGRELRMIVGHSRVEQLPPDQREKVVRVIDDLSETTPMRIALLIDASASMKPKLQAVRDAIQDLQLSLQARNGTSELAVFHFPGDASSGEEVVMDRGWTSDLANLNKLFYKINMRGTTPTGPALMRVIRFMTGAAQDQVSDAQDITRNEGRSKDGMLSDYVV